jgi:hypothetical protein
MGVLFAIVEEIGKSFLLMYSRAGLASQPGQAIARGEDAHCGCREKRHLT